MLFAGLFCDTFPVAGRIPSGSRVYGLRVPGVLLTLVSFYAYCAGEATCFLWTPSYFAGTKAGISDERIAVFGSLVFGGLMAGRLISGFISDRLVDRRLIRIGIGFMPLYLLVFLAMNLALLETAYRRYRQTA